MILFALVFSPHVSRTYADEGISATLIVTSNLSTVGDIVDLTVEVTHPVGYRLVPLDLASSWGEFEVRSLSRVTVEDEVNGMTRSRQTISVTLWAPGEYQTPPLLLQVSDSTGQVREVSTESVFLTVGSVVQDDDTELRELKEQATLPRPPIWPLALGGGLLGWLLLALAWWLYRSWRNRRAQLPQEAPDLRSTYQKTLDELERIEGLNLPTQGRFKEHYTLLADTIRHYLEETYPIQANEQTTEEIQQAVADLSMPDEQKRGLFQLLHDADMVKFANVVPDLSQAREQAERAREFVLMSRTITMTAEMTSNLDDEAQAEEQEVTS